MRLGRVEEGKELQVTRKAYRRRNRPGVQGEHSRPLQVLATQHSALESAYEKEEEAWSQPTELQRQEGVFHISRWYPALPLSCVSALCLCEAGLGD